MQLYEQTLRERMLFIPRLNPSLLDVTGPKAIIFYLFQTNVQNILCFTVKFQISYFIISVRWKFYCSTDYRPAAGRFTPPLAFRFVANDRFLFSVISNRRLAVRDLPVRRDFSSQTRRNDSIDEIFCHRLIMPKNFGWILEMTAPNKIVISTTKEEKSVTTRLHKSHYLKTSNQD